MSEDMRVVTLVLVWLCALTTVYIIFKILVRRDKRDDE